MIFSVNQTANNLTFPKPNLGEYNFKPSQNNPVFLTALFRMSADFIQLLSVRLNRMEGACVVYVPVVDQYYI